MADPGRPVTGYPAPNPNGYAANPPPPGTSYPYAAAYYGNQSNPYYQPNPNAAARRPTWLRRFLAVVIGLVVIFATVIFIVWLVVRPQLPKFRVDSFSLTNLTLDNASVISFSAEVRLTARNPNKKITLSYDNIVALIYYESSTISDTALPPFSQGTKNDTSLTANFAAVGRFVDKAAIDEMNSERRSGGTIAFTLRVLSRVKFKTRAWRSRRRYLRVFCGDLAVGVPINGKPGMLTGGSRRCRDGF